MMASIFIGAAISLLLYLWNIYTYWRRRGVTGPTPLPFVGNYLPVLLCQEKETELLHRIYVDYPNEKCVGIYKGFTPVMLVRDPKLIRQILTTDMLQFFARTSNIGHIKLDKHVAGANDYGLWRVLRTSMSLLNTPKQIALSSALCQNSVKEYLKCIENLVNRGPDHDLTVLQRKFCLELGGAVVLGRELGCFSENSHVEMQLKKLNQRFLKQKKLYKWTAVYPTIYKKIVKPVLELFFHPTYKFYSNLVRDSSNVSKNTTPTEPKSKSILDILNDIRGKTYTYRETSINIDDDLIVQQAFVSIFSNYVSVSNAVALLLHNLAHNQVEQEKVREEINRTLGEHDGNIEIEKMPELKYLDMAIDETLRLNSANGCIGRFASTKYTFPDTDITVEKDTLVFMVHQAMQRDPKYYPNADVFNPERFSQENKEMIPKGVNLTFGYGPRFCSGMQLAKYTIKLAVIHFLHQFEVSPSGKDQLKSHPYVLNENIPGGVWVKVTRRS